MAERKTKAADETAPGDQQPETVAAPQAAPIDAPAKRPAHLGVQHQSTDFVAANAALRTPPGSAHQRLVDHAGADLGPDDLFHFPPADAPSSIATTKQRIYQQFTYPNASTPATQLLYPAGATVPVEQALQVRAAVKAVADASA